MSRDYGRIQRDVPCVGDAPYGGGRNWPSRYKRKVRAWKITGGYCFYCAITLDFYRFEIDHVKARHRGGRDEDANKVPACRACNNNKRFRDAIEWATACGYTAAVDALRLLGA